jgi:hypothetical protein
MSVTEANWPRTNQHNPYLTSANRFNAYANVPHPDKCYHIQTPGNTVTNRSFEQLQDITWSVLSSRYSFRIKLNKTCTNLLNLKVNPNPGLITLRYKNQNVNLPIKDILTVTNNFLHGTDNENTHQSLRTWSPVSGLSADVSVRHHEQMLQSSDVMPVLHELATCTISRFYDYTRTDSNRSSQNWTASEKI